MKPMCDQQDLGGSSEVDAEKAGVWTVWTHVEQLLAGDREMAETFVRTLMAQLPHPAVFTSRELYELANLHLGSARNVMKTMRLMAPTAFNDEGALYPEPYVLDTLEGAALSTVSVVIELQLFHLQRAAMLTAHVKARLFLRQLNPEAASALLSNSSSHGKVDSDC